MLINVNLFQVFLIFPSLRCFQFSFFVSVSLFTFFRCFHFLSFLAVSIFSLSQVFHFSTFFDFFVLLCNKCLGFERAFFTIRPFSKFTRIRHNCHSTASATYLRELLLLSGFFILHFYPIFDTTCIHRCFSGSQQFLLECCQTSHWG